MAFWNYMAQGFLVMIISCLYILLVLQHYAHLHAYHQNKKPKVNWCDRGLGLGLSKLAYPSVWRPHWSRHQNMLRVWIKAVAIQPLRPEGGTDSLSLSTNCETTAPLFGQRTSPVLLPPNLQPPLYMGAQGQPLDINHEWWIFYIEYILFYLTIVPRGSKNKFEFIQ